MSSALGQFRRSFVGVGVALVLLISVSLSQAATLTNLYTLSMPVADQTAASRNAVLPAAFQAMLVRLSGNSQVASLSNVADALKNPGNYLQAYAYHRDPQQGLEVALTFSKAAVNQLLASANQAIWAATRPDVLVWLAVKTSQGTQLLNDDSQSPWVAAINEQAKDRGLPLLYPMLDISDDQALSAGDVLSLNDAKILQASARYVPDAVLAVAIDASNPAQITSQWDLQSSGKTEHFQASGSNMASVVQTGLDAVTDELAKNYAVQVDPNGGSVVMITVQGVQNVSAYAQITRYLDRLDAAENVMLQSVFQNQMNFIVTAKGSVDVLKREIALGQVLRPGKVVDGTQAGSALIYDYRH